MKKVLCLVLISRLINGVTFSNTNELSIDINSNNSEVRHYTKQEICHCLREAYFRNRHTKIQRIIEKHLNNNIDEVYSNQNNNDIQAIFNQIAVEKSPPKTPELESKIKEVVIKATTEALEKEKKKSDSKVSKSRCIALSTIATATGTIVTAIVALIIHLTQNECDNN